MCDLGHPLRIGSFLQLGLVLLPLECEAQVIVIRLSAEEIAPDDNTSAQFDGDQQRIASDISAGTASDGDLVMAESPLRPVLSPHP